MQDSLAERHSLPLHVALQCQAVAPPTKSSASDLQMPCVETSHAILSETPQPDIAAWAYSGTAGRGNHKVIRGLQTLSMDVFQSIEWSVLWNRRNFTEPPVGTQKVHESALRSSVYLPFATYWPSSPDMDLSLVSRLPPPSSKTVRFVSHHPPEPLGILRRVLIAATAGILVMRNLLHMDCKTPRLLWYDCKKKEFACNPTLVRWIADVALKICACAIL